MASAGRPVLEVTERQPDQETGKPSILFVHGAAHGAWCWQHWMEMTAAAGYPSHAVSLRGHAGSEGSLMKATLSSYVDDVIRTAATLPGQPILVGHSLGGLVVQRTIARVPVRAAVLVAPLAARSGYRTLFSIFRQHPGDGAKILLGGSIPMRYDYLFESLSKSEADGYIELCGGESSLAQFQVIFHRPSPGPVDRAPVLVLGTPEDNLIPPADLRDTARRYSATLSEFPGMGHDLMLDEGRQEPGKAMVDWLNQVC
ncbi:MAG: alpha/beta hydrolase [Thermoleophilia bacterium]|nr:alpha/beta hydrolase [Thermoleophilia bacterium]